MIFPSFFFAPVILVPANKGNPGTAGKAGVASQTLENTYLLSLLRGGTPRRIIVHDLPPAGEALSRASQLGYTLFSPVTVAFAMAETTNENIRRPVFEEDDLELPVERLRVQPVAGRRTGCPFHDVREMLREVNLRPTRQRLALGWLMFAKGDRHITAELLHEEALRARFPVSLATVYNTLHQFTEVNLLREVAVDGSKTYFDTNSTDHHHFYVEGQNELLDIPGAEVMVDRMPTPPEGYEVARVDVVVRLRRKNRA
jgi:Fur family iron response transcriptional regulator